MIMKRLFALLLTLVLATATGAATNNYNILDTNAVAEAPVANVANQSVAYTGTAAQSATVNASTGFAIVTCMTDCYVAYGSNPTATTSDMYLPAFTPSPRLKATGGATKYSIIRYTASGSAQIAEFSR